MVAVSVSAKLLPSLVAPPPQESVHFLFKSGRQHPSRSLPDQRIQHVANYVRIFLVLIYFLHGVSLQSVFLTSFTNWKDTPFPLLTHFQFPQLLTLTLRLVRNTLSEAGYAPILTSDPGEMSHLLKEEDPQLILLNLVLPGRDGFELMKDISNMFDVPVIFVSGRGRGQDVARAFELGAADYVVKPFSPTELVARISAALRRRTVEHRTESYLLGDLVIDYVEGRVTMAGRPLQLTPTEYKLLCELSAGAGRVVPHGQLLQRVWGDSSSEDHALLRSCVKNLRQKLGDDARNPSYIITVPRTGYRMAAQ